MDLTSHGKWRKSKVESFIRRHLNSSDLGVTRYYEMCMWDNKGTLAPSYAILMDSTIILTENPPKSLIHRIPLAAIQDISLIADRYSHIRGKNNNLYICQHVAIVYETSNSKKNKTTNSDSNKKRDNLKSGEGWKLDHDQQTGESRSSSSLMYLNDDSEDWESRHSQIYQSIASSRYSEMSLSPAPSSSLLNESFGSSFLLNGYHRHHHHHHNSIKIVDNCNTQIWIKDYENFPRDGDHSPIKKGGGKSKTLFTERKKGLMKEVNYEVRSRSSHASSPEFWQQPHHLKKKDRYLGVSNYPSRASTPQRSNNGEGRRESDGLINRRKLTCVDDDLEADGKEQENPNKGTKNKKNGGADESPKNQRNNNKKQQAKATEKVQEIHLYLYQRDSEFLNEISLVWNRQQLKNMEKQDEDELGLSTYVGVNKSLRIAEKVANQVAKDWHRVEEEEEEDDDDDYEGGDSLLQSGYYGNTLLRKVNFLHKCLLRYENLKYFCWKNTVIMSGLINALTLCLEPVDLMDSADKYPLNNIAEVYLNKLATYNILMEIFRTLFEACSVSCFKESELNAKSSGDSEEFINEWEVEVDKWDYKLTTFEVTQKLMIFILKCPFLPQDCNKVAHVPNNKHSYLPLADSDKKVKTQQWLTLGGEDSAKVAGLICTAHNASVALLFELLAMSHFLPKSIEQALVVSGTHQMNLENFIRLSVTQIITILWSSNEPLNASQTMVLYRQVWNLRTLIKHNRKILNYVRQNFSEEFHYYIRSKGIKSRIPDKYTIKYKLIDACEKLCETIVGK